MLISHACHDQKNCLISMHYYLRCIRTYICMKNSRWQVVFLSPISQSISPNYLDKSIIDWQMGTCKCRLRLDANVHLVKVIGRSVLGDWKIRKECAYDRECQWQMDIFIYSPSIHPSIRYSITTRINVSICQFIIPSLIKYSKRIHHFFLCQPLLFNYWEIPRPSHLFH